MKVTVYHLKNCDTCKKAIKAMEAAGHDLELIDVRADGVSKTALEKIADAVGMEAMLNTRSTTWRGLSEADKKDVSRKKALELMTQHPTLMKRPVIDTGNTITVGWTSDVQDKFA